LTISLSVGGEHGRASALGRFKTESGDCLQNRVRGHQGKPQPRRL